MEKIVIFNMDDIFNTKMGYFEMSSYSVKKYQIIVHKLDGTICDSCPPHFVDNANDTQRLYDNCIIILKKYTGKIVNAKITEQKKNQIDFFELDKLKELPEDLSTLICQEISHQLPLNLKYLSCDSIQNGHHIPSSVTHLAINSNIDTLHIYLPTLTFLKLTCDGNFPDIDFSNYLPNLEILYITDRAQYDQYTSHVNYLPTSIFRFARHDRDYATDLIPGYFFGNNAINFENFPKTITKMMISAVISMDNVDLTRFNNLKILGCGYGSTIYPESLKSLIIEFPYVSVFWNDTRLIKEFIGRIGHVETLAVPHLSEKMYEEFCNYQMINTIFINNCPIFDITGLSDRAVICEQINTPYISALKAAYIVEPAKQKFYSSNIILLMDNDNQTRFVSDSGVEMMKIFGHSIDYLYIGDHAITGIMGDPLSVHMIAVPEKYVDNHKKSARK